MAYKFYLGNLSNRNLSNIHTKQVRELVLHLPLAPALCLGMRFFTFLHLGCPIFW